MDSPAESMGKASPQETTLDNASDSSECQFSRSLPYARLIIVLTDADPVTVHCPPNQPTLLGIPQELRNKIFEYVYGLPDAADDCIKTELLASSLIIGITTRPSLVEGAAVRLNSNQAPPSKDPLLVCRRLWFELRYMQAAAYRRYWTESTFDICRDHISLADGSCDIPSSELRYAKHFIIHVHYGRAKIAVRLHFQAGKWIGTFRVPSHDWALLRQPSNTNVPAPQGLLCLIGFEDEMRDTSTKGAFSGQQTMNPERGLGFTPDHLRVAERAIWSLIYDGFTHGYGLMHVNAG
jgi:hypothetical protein